MPAPYTIAVPWDSPVMLRLGGSHPLPNSLIADTRSFRFTRALQPATPEAGKAFERDRQTLMQALNAMSRGGLPEEVRQQFIVSRHPDSQVAMGTPADLLFLHSAPVTLSQRPWALHVETSLSLFEPYFGHFRTWDINLPAHPAYYMVRHLLRHPNCRGILTHVMRTADELPRLLGDETLAAKIYYAPLGLDPDPVVRALADAAIQRKDMRGPKDDLTILFANSWRDAPQDFYLRGGIETVLGFLQLLETVPSARLILRSCLPADANPKLLAGLRSHPRIELHETKLPEAQFLELLGRADVFLLPSTGLHALSILRAMSFGAVVVTTDAPAIEEFVTHGDNGVVLKAREGVTWRYDAQAGLLRERLPPLGGAENTALAGEIAGTLRRLAEDRGLAIRLRQSARQRTDTMHTLAGWREGFHSMLRACRAA